MTLLCPAKGELVEQALNRLATQYREAEKFIGYTRHILGQIEEAAQATCAIPEFFDLDTAIGHQLTLIGKRMGWPRCHCVCVPIPVFGFDCGGPNAIPIVGFCEGGAWINCEIAGNGEICLDDDEVYRGYLKARRYQILGLYDIISLQAALRHVWGEQAFVVEAGAGRIVLAPSRILTPLETIQMPLVVRVMPIAPGIRVTVFLGTGSVFGFGEGWGGLCEGAEWLCETDPHAYDCAA